MSLEPIKAERKRPHRAHGEERGDGLARLPLPDALALLRSAMLLRYE